MHGHRRVQMCINYKPVFLFVYSLHMVSTKSLTSMEWLEVEKLKLGLVEKCRDLSKSWGFIINARYCVLFVDALRELLLVSFLW